MDTGTSMGGQLTQAGARQTSRADARSCTTVLVVTGTSMALGGAGDLSRAGGLPSWSRAQGFFSGRAAKAACLQHRATFLQSSERSARLPAHSLVRRRLRLWIISGQGGRPTTDERWPPRGETFAGARESMDSRLPERPWAGVMPGGEFPAIAVPSHAPSRAARM
jgi:hypothetical protein